jgi:glycosyltransferase involved in cell wall biosynthesis
MAIGSETASELPGVTLARGANRRGTTAGMFPLAVRAEADLIRAYAAFEAARALRAQGFDPKVVIGHPGWGETVLMKEIFPNARLILFHEFYYAGHGLDIGFDPEFGVPAPATVLAGTTKNAVQALALSQADAIVAPTRFQASTLPPIFRAAARIIHEGIDVQTASPGSPAPFEVPAGPTILPGTPVITHVNRNLEALRGLHILLRALPRLQAEVPGVQTIIVGSAERRAYGGAAPDGKTWKEISLERAGEGLDLSRVHFTGPLPHGRMIEALRLSSAHVYYTYPFVLSWSLAEAMACGAYVIGSDTAPMRDAIEDGVNGRLLPFFDVDALSQAMVDACRAPEAAAPLRAAARRTAVERFDQAKGRAAWLDLLREVGGI